MEQSVFVLCCCFGAVPDGTYLTSGFQIFIMGVAVAIHRHKVCRERRNLYLHFLHRLNKSYLAEEKAGEE